MRRFVVASALLAMFLAGSLGLAPAPLGAAAPRGSASVAAAPAPANALAPRPRETAAAVPAAVQAAPTDAERAASALSFLRDAQKPDGSIDGSIAETADFIIATAGAHFDPATLAACSGTTALGYLAVASDKATGDAGKTGKAILAVKAAHLDPAAFQGRDLLARLAAIYHPTTGVYGDGSTFGQSLAILAVHASGAPVPAPAVAYLAALQDTDGSWNFQARSDSTDGDTNSTAIALIALAAVRDASTNAKAFAYLHTQQLADGGFPYQNSTAFGTPASDPDSDALVIQAFEATGQDPAAAEWSKGANNALTHLRSTQAANGGFTFPGNPSPDAFTTTQAVMGLTGVVYGTATEFTAGASVARAACPAAAAATATPGPAATARPATTPPPTTSLSGGASAAFPPLAPVGLISLALGFALGLARVVRRRSRSEA